MEEHQRRHIMREIYQYSTPLNQLIESLALSGHKVVIKIETKAVERPRKGGADTVAVPIVEVTFEERNW